MSEVTLTDFLLARISEDEAVASEVAAEDARIQDVIDYHYDEPDTSFWADTDGARPSVSVGPARVLAECEAKRRIVEIHNGGTLMDQPLTHVCDGTHGVVECRTLAALALPYSAHPDYREEWKP